MNLSHRLLVRTLSLFAALSLQVMPMIRSALPALYQCLPSSGWAIVFRWAAGGVAMFGYHAVSRASSIAISPPNATVGQPYVGTITYSGGHAGAVSSMSLSNMCLNAVTPLFDGLSIIYSGGNTATVTGTPQAAGTFTFALRIFDGASCGQGNSDMRTTSLVVGDGGGGGIAPLITSPPEGITAQVGAGALLSAGASGNPTPNYYWYRGIPNIAANLVGTNASLEFPVVSLEDAGLYTVVASNDSGQATAPAYLSVVFTPGTNQLVLNYTNYYPQGQALTMYSYLTNVMTGSNVYKWQFNSVDITPYSTSGNTLSLTANQVTPGRSGKYSVVFNSVVGSSTVVNQQLYYSYWAFGLPPAMSEDPQGDTVQAGSDVVLTATATNVSVPAITPTLPDYGTNTPLTFRWYRNGSELLATLVTNGLVATEQLVLSSVTAADEGEYTVEVSNYWGSVTSSPAVVTLAASASPPSITSEPAAASVLAGQNARFSVTASGTQPLSYQWQRDHTNLLEGGVYSGVNSNVLTLAGVGTQEAGVYSVVVSNSGGSSNSVDAPLTVAMPPEVSVTADANGLHLNASTFSGLDYVVWTTTNLASPWISIATNTIPASGQLSFTNATAHRRQFFKVEFP